MVNYQARNTDESDIHLIVNHSVFHDPEESVIADTSFMEVVA